MVSTSRPLLTDFGTPQGGWFANFVIKGIKYQFHGDTGYEVFKDANEKLARNGMDVKPTDLWANLNVQWYDRTAEKHLLVRPHVLFDELVALSEKNSNVTENPYTRNYGPEHWGHAAWNFMGYYLAQDLYSWNKFLEVLGHVLDMTNKSSNPSIGCAECYMHFSSEVLRLKSNPLYSVSEARNWLVNFHNSVNKRLSKPMVSFDTASKKYLWQ